ncbi:cytochrome P450 [Streptomyces sp. NPDC048428]|uniref:cytochrome P450 n=1 Tax=Streptomyces sp. NPDC048428 TaxID=3154503 RepID=UPI003417266F
MSPYSRFLFYPELPRLLPCAYHPKSAQIEIASNGWIRKNLAVCFADESDLLFFLRQRNGIYGPLTVPRASDQRALDIADWYQYVTVIDSSVSDRSALGADGGVARRIFGNVLAEFTGGARDTAGQAGHAPSPQEIAYGTAAKDLWQRISPGLSPAQVKRFGVSLEAFLRGCTTEIEAKLTDSVPDYEACVQVRLESFGCDFIELMTEYGAAVDMSEHLPELAELHYHCRRQMIIINDLLSWRKEQAQDDKMTVVRVLTEREGHSPQDAVHRLSELVEHHERKYIETRDALLAGSLGSRDDVVEYLTAVDHLMGGSQEFEYLTPRYYGDGSVWDGSTSGWLDLDAPIVRFQPERPTAAATAGADFTSVGGRKGVVSKAGDESGSAAESASAPASGAHCPVDHGAAASSRTPARRPATDRTYRVATAPGAVPALGHALQLWRRPLEFLEDLPARGDLVEIRLGPKKAYLACHPDLVMRVLLEARTFDKGGPLFEKARALVGNGLVSSEWEDHRTQRRLLQPAFHPSRMPGYVSLMGEEVEDVIEGWQSGKAFDVSDAMHALTLRITARTMFATTVADRAIPEVAYCMPIIMRGVYQRMVAPTGWQERLPTPGNRRYEAVKSRMHNVISETIEEQREAGTDRGDLLSILVNARDEETGAGLTDEEIYDQVMTLLIGGTETTGNTMAWVFHLLAAHPQVEKRLHAELDEVLADGRAPTFEDLPRLDYTWRVLNETLRMFPPAWLLTRTTTRQTELAGKQLSPGTIVMYSPYALGRNPVHFDNPRQFDPDRWLPERSGEVPRGAMVPFSAGNRQCIGDAFGQAETTLTLATIASRWRLRPAPGAKPNVAVPKASLGTGPLLMVPSPRHPTPSQDGLVLSDIA